jgi:hypothetical protein
LKIEPTFTVENLFRAPMVETIEDGVVIESGREQRETVFELILALDVPTAIPRLGLTFEAIFKPFGSTDVNPFTGASAHSIGRSDIRDNGIEIEAELNIHLLPARFVDGCRPMSTWWTTSPAACQRRQRVHAQTGLAIRTPPLQPAGGGARLPGREVEVCWIIWRRLPKAETSWEANDVQRKPVVAVLRG